MDSDISGVLSKKYHIKAINDGLYFPGKSRFLRSFYLKTAKNFILAGGSLFNDEEMVQSLLERSPFIKHGDKALAMGISVGSFCSTKHEQNTLEFLKRVAYIGFRDDYSYEWAKSKKLDVPFVRAFDLAVLLPMAVSIDTSSGEKEKRLGISPCAFNYTRNRSLLAKDIEFISALAKATYDIARAKGFNITLYSLCRNPAYNDDIVCAAFRNSLPPDSNVAIFEHDGDAYRTWADMDRCSHMVSMRLHGGVFAYSSNTPLIMLAYHKKCSDFAQTVGLDDTYLLNPDGLDLQKYKNSLDHLLDDQRIRTTLPLEKAKERALRNFGCFSDATAMDS